MPKFQPPDYFNFESPGEWKDWRARFARYAIISKLSTETANIQVNTLVYSIGPKAETVYSSFKWAAAEEKTLASTLDKFEEYFTPQRNVIHERAQFHLRKQKTEETIETYTRALYEQAAKCDFPDAHKETHIRDQLVVGLSDMTLSEKLQMTKDLKLEDAMTMARQHELMQDQIKEQQHQSGSVSEVSRRGNFARGRSRGRSSYGSSYGRSYGKSSSSTWQAGHSSSHGAQQDTCGKCGNSHEAGRCPAKRVKCNRCGVNGHFASVCKSDMSRRGRGRGQGRHVREVAVPDQADESQETSFFLGAVTQDSDIQKPWEVTLRLCGTPTVFKIDTGADVTIITEKTYKALKNSPPLKSGNIRLESVGGKLTCLGMFQAKVWPKKSKQVYLVNVYVVQGSSNNLLSRVASSAMGYVSLTLNETVNVPYGEVGLMDVKPVRIKLKPNAEPYSLHSARRVPLPLMESITDLSMDRQVVTFSLKFRATS